jgi:DNA-binding HxlR family transcriptional regulator
VALLDDVIIGVAAAVSTTSITIMFSLLARYRKLVSEQTRSGELAKSLWESMNARLTTQDTRIVDLMARFEVYSVRKNPPTSPPPARNLATKSVESHKITGQRTISQPSSQLESPIAQSEKVTNDTEATILRSLLDGPRTSNAIREVISVSREHNARLLKGLYERGLVLRNDEHKPFVYEITDSGRAYLRVA